MTENLTTAAPASVGNVAARYLLPGEVIVAGSTGTLAVSQRPAVKYRTFAPTAIIVGTNDLGGIESVEVPAEQMIPTLGVGATW